MEMIVDQSQSYSRRPCSSHTLFRGSKKHMLRILLENSFLQRGRQLSRTIMTTHVVETDEKPAVNRHGKPSVYRRFLVEISPIFYHSVPIQNFFPLSALSEFDRNRGPRILSMRLSRRNVPHLSNPFGY